MDLLFSGWLELVRTAIIGLSAYITLLVMLRSSGKRSLTKMTAFDFITTVAVGSMVANAIFASEVKLDKTILGFVLIFGAQRSVLWLSMKSPWFHRMVTTELTLIVHRGRILEEVMQQHNVTEDELLTAVRHRGHASLQEIEFVIMEQDGSFSVLAYSDVRQPSALSNVPELRT